MIPALLSAVVLLALGKQPRRVKRRRKTNPIGRLKRAAKLPRRLSKALRRGARVEREHTTDAKTARIIASHHLAEDPRYYEKLAKIEKHNPVDVSVNEVIASMKRADAEGRHGVRGADHYDDWRKHPRWTLVALDPNRIHAVPIDEESIPKISARGVERLEPAVITATRPGNMIAQDGNHRVLAARLAGTTIRAYVPTTQIANVIQANPPTAAVMSYAQAHAWEPQAVERKVSVVARSARGFMRAYQRAGSWSKLSPWWQRRRNNFVARHLAQAGINGERLWEQVRGKWRPTRRGLALIMWCFMPPGRPKEARPNEW